MAAAGPANAASAPLSWRPVNDAPAMARASEATAALIDGHLIYSTMSRPGGVERYELEVEAKGRDLRGRVLFGEKACGHPAIVHGGALATVIDDALGMLFFQCGVGSGFTANLNVNYRRPVPASAPLRILCSVDKLEPSKSGASTKVFLSARLVGEVDEQGEGPLYTEATALYIAKVGAMPPPGLAEAAQAALAAPVGASEGLQE